MAIFYHVDRSGRSLSPGHLMTVGLFQWTPETAEQAAILNKNFPGGVS
jgi:hypothetical protein